ncbi:hypothetical protein BS639_05710 [Rouxiella silvae]|uniref:Uncharacterized protein n=1 Tax=Rouxiella silvae TaxID=1646373 RepID=A0ABX3U3M7_9GAMM|nr:hypothetical protein BS639_05710 [Rouxiella silvae]
MNFMFFLKDKLSVYSKIITALINNTQGLLPHFANVITLPIKVFYKPELSKKLSQFVVISIISIIY